MEASLTELILEWQALGEPEGLSLLVKSAQPVIERTATQWLKRHHMFTPARVDEILSVVLDHLRRLHVEPGSDQAVTSFTPEPDGNDEAGLRYIRWLTKRRTQDLIRTERRRLRRHPTLTEARVATESLAAVRQGRDAATRQESVDGLHQAMQSLSQRDRDVIEGLLKGQSQSQIAAVLGVSEGTVSRHKKDALTRLKNMLFSAPSACVETDLTHAAAEATPFIDRESHALPFVGVQYETHSAGKAVFHRHHRWYVFSCLVRGALDLSWVRKGRQQTSHQNPGTCNFFFPEDADDDYLWEPTSEAAYHTILVPPEYFAAVAESEGMCGLHDMRPVFGFQDPTIESTILSLRRCRHDVDCLACECDGRRLVTRILERLGYGKADWTTDESVFTARESQRVREFVDAHLHGRITLQQLAGIHGLSPGHFIKKCSRTFGVTPSRFVSIRRVQRVADLLRATEEPIEHISRSTGFCSPSHCTNTFRAILGIPPSHFRAEMLRR